jgi:minor extracellular protease Epr
VKNNENNNSGKMTDYNLLLKNIPENWKNNQGVNTKIAILDTGIYENHPDFDNLFLNKSFNFTSSPYSYSDNNGHGTHISGIIGARSKRTDGIIGVAPACEMYTIKVIEDDGTTSATNLNKGLEFLLTKEIDIINLSLNINEARYNIVKSTIDKLIQKGVIIVAAAGNNTNLLNGNSLLTPANKENIISVGAISQSFIDKNPDLILNQHLDFLFIEDDILSCSTQTNLYYKKEKGCSQSTAFLTGIIALLKSHNRDLSLSEIKIELNKVAEMFTNKQYESNLCLIKNNRS